MAEIKLTCASTPVVSASVLALSCPSLVPNDAYSSSSSELCAAICTHPIFISWYHWPHQHGALAVKSQLRSPHAQRQGHNNLQLARDLQTCVSFTKAHAQLACASRLSKSRMILASGTMCLHLIVNFVCCDLSFLINLGFFYIPACNNIEVSAVLYCHMRQTCLVA